MATPDHEAELRIADVLISAFQTAVLQSGTTRDRVFLLPTMAPTKREKVTAQLAGLPKPITCIGFGNPTALVLGYWVVPSGVKDSFNMRYPDIVRRAHAKLASNWHVDDVNSVVAIALDSGAATLSWGEYWSLREEYFTPYLAWYEERPTASAAREGHVCSVRVQASGGIITAVH